MNLPYPILNEIILQGDNLYNLSFYAMIILYIDFMPETKI